MLDQQIVLEFCIFLIKSQIKYDPITQHLESEVVRSEAIQQNSIGSEASLISVYGRETLPDQKGTSTISFLAACFLRSDP